MLLEDFDELSLWHVEVGTLTTIAIDWRKNLLTGELVDSKHFDLPLLDRLYKMGRGRTNTAKSCHRLGDRLTFSRLSFILLLKMKMTVPRYSSCATLPSTS